MLTFSLVAELKLQLFKVAKYIAKLRLLDFGLIDAAESVDQIEIRRPEDKDNEDSGQETVEEESLREFEGRLNAFVAISIAQTPGSSRDSYKQGQVFNTRKSVISEFLKETAVKRCYNEDCFA